MTLLALSGMMMLGMSALRVVQLSTRIAHAERERTHAFYAAEAALADAQRDIVHGSRATLFAQPPASAPVAVARTDAAYTREPFVPGICQRNGTRQGLCQSAPGQPPIWLTINFDDDSVTAPSVAHGTFTGARLPVARLPRYVIEALPAIPRAPDETSLDGLYRITAAGYGPTLRQPVILQSVYRRARPAAPSEAGSATQRPPTGRLSWREITTWDEMRADAIRVVLPVDGTAD
ncbi:MAG: hypothetical protein EPN65_13195 [Pandoraea sp.]|nr:hypothetical protein [Pandoraea sp.]TAM16814.1 MAG: hypothetical protein EPN65_13195 [Pandoraea sp.]